MLEKELGLDAVDVCTHRHDFVAISSLKSGKHVTIEKPFGFTIKECKGIMEFIQEGKILSIAEGARRTPDARTIHWCIQEEKIRISLETMI